MKYRSLSHCQQARTLLKNGQSNYRGEETDRNLAQRVFDITTKFMQPIDVLALDIRSVDELLPSIRDVQGALQAYPNLPSNYEGLAKVQNWLNKMQAMRASDELSESDARQLKMDLDDAMQQFKDIVLSKH